MEIHKNMKAIKAAVICMLFTPTLAVAGTGNTILNSNNSVSIGFNYANNNYSEDLPIPSDVENGWTPGFHIGASFDSEIIGIKGIYGDFGYTYNSGNVTYTDNNIHVRLGKTIFISNSAALTPYIMGGYRWWHRTVPNGVNAYVGGGAMFQYAVTKDLTLSLHGGVGEVVFASLVEHYSSPVEQKFSFSDRPYYTAGLKATYINSKHLGLYADVDYRDFMRGASGFNSAGFKKPSSQTSRFSVGVGLMYSFT
jgi:hypothetical protein